MSSVCNGRCRVIASWQVKRSNAAMSNVQRFGAVADGKTDATDAIQHAVTAGDGILNFPRGEYLISRPIEILLDECDRTAIDGLGGTAKVIMAGPGPAFHLVGTHQGTADPGSFEERVWQRQRLPTVCNIEIEGRHEQATGLLLEGVMQPTLQGVLCRRLLDGIRLTGRCRNVILSTCHIYENRRYGIFFDRLNLHQANISASHISYNPVAGICIRESEVRNLQITGNDIEYNYSPNVDGSADVLIDCSAAGSTVREATICSNTIQARFSPNGANIRIRGLSPEQNQNAGMITISGNLIGSQQVGVHLVACRGVVVTGNVIYSGHDRNLLVESSRNIVVGPNGFDHNPGYNTKEICTGIRLVDTVNSQISGCVIQDASAGKTTVENSQAFPRLGLVELIRSSRIGISGCHVLDGAPCGIYAEDCSDILLSGTTVAEVEAESPRSGLIRWKGIGLRNLITGCHIGPSGAPALEIAAQAGVMLQANLVE